MKRLNLILCCIVIITTFAYAHSGRTDSKGGHYNRSTGEYHYHHGKPAHDICALYVNKYMCIKNNLCSYNEIKEEHCLKMYDKLLKLAKITEPHKPDSTQTTMLDNLFK